MKRRNADCGKLRRPMKRNKITEGMYGRWVLKYIQYTYTQIVWIYTLYCMYVFKQLIALLCLLLGGRARIPQ